MDASISAAAAADLCIVQQPTPAESSLLWDFQEAFYKQQGMKCWVDNTVPSFVTSNAFIANVYAKVLLSYMRDWYASGRADRSQPMYIVEVGAGHGKLAFLLLRELMEAWQSWPDLGRDADMAVDTSVHPVPYTMPNSPEVAFVAGPHPIEAGAGAGASAGAQDRHRLPRLSGKGARAFGHGPGGRRAPFRMVITDCAESSVSWWQSHESLQPYFEAGVLDVACWDAHREESMSLRVAKAADGIRPLVLGPGSLANPILGIANYTFDTLRQCVFRFIEGRVEQGMAALYSTHAADADAVAAAVAAATGRNVPVVLDGSMLPHLRVVWSYRPISLALPTDAAPTSSPPDDVPTPTLEQVLHDPLAASVVRAYAQRRGINAGTCLSIPFGGLGAMRRLSAISCGRLFLLAGDKSYAHESELGSMGLADPHVAQHASCSFMVNMHALRLVTLSMGPDSCFSLHTPYVDGFKVHAFVWDSPGRAGERGKGAGGAALNATQLWAAASVPMPSWAATAWPETTFTWADCMDTFGPENFGTLQRCVREEVQDPSLKLVLATIRMACWDPDVAFKFKQTLIDKVPSASDRVQADVYRDVQEMYSRYYPLSPSKDLAFELGRVCMGMRRYHEALALFWASVRHTGEHHVTVYNIGICLFHLGPGHHAASRAAFNRSLVLKPDYEDAVAWKTRVLAKMQEDGEVPAS